MIVSRAIIAPQRSLMKTDSINQIALQLARENARTLADNLGLVSKSNPHRIFPRRAARSRCRRESSGDRWALPPAPHTYPAFSRQLINTLAGLAKKTREIQICTVYCR
jgi:hypothetical protein